MSGNLFTDVYEMQKMFFGKDAESQETMENCRKEIFDVIEKEQVPQKLKYLMFKMTNRCNSDCEYCSHAINSKIHEEKKDIPFSIIKKTIREAGELGVEALSINGGEPLLMENIGDIVTETVEQNIIPVLMTNGLLLPEKWEMLSERGLRYVILSFDSLEPSIYEKQRGVSFESGMAGVKAALDMKSRYHDAEIHVTSVLTRQNMEEMPEFILRMSDMGISVQLSPYHHFNPMKKDELSIRDKDEARRLTDVLLQLKSDGCRIANSVGFLSHIPTFFVEGKRVPDGYECLIGYTNLFVDAYMNARSCWASCFEPVGNIGSQSLKEIWYGEKMQEYRNKMLKCQCEGCWYLCTGEVSMFLNNMLEF